MILTNEEIKQIQCDGCKKKEIGKHTNFWVCTNCGMMYEEWELPDLMKEE